MNSSNRRHLRGLCHKLHPLVTIADRGLAESVMTELEGALEHHELVKIKLANDDRDERDEWIEQILSRTGAELIQQIGKVACLFRRNPAQQKIHLPD